MNKSIDHAWGLLDRDDKIALIKHYYLMGVKAKRIAQIVGCSQRLIWPSVKGLTLKP